MYDCILYIEDGTLFRGKNFGSKGTRFGELIFNTGMTGYQEILTDPSYKGQIVVMTYVHIGNYGINAEDDESRECFLEGFVIKEVSPVVSNWRAKNSLQDYLEERGVVGIEGIDTRYLTLKIRNRGAMRAVLTTEDVDTYSLKNMLDEYPGIVGQDLVKYVSCSKKYEFAETVWRHQSLQQYEKFERDIKIKPKIVVYDFGVKRNILRHLAEYFQVVVVPATTTSEDVMKMNPAGVLLSNGPGDPEPLHYAIENTRRLLGKIPVFGICLGHQIIALAIGAKTYKLKFGHHGVNHPVKNMKNGKVEITSQNHGFAVDKDTIPDSVELTHISLNDGTVEGFESDNFVSVQYHPESAPGPHDSSYIFEKIQEYCKII